MVLGRCCSRLARQINESFSRSKRIKGRVLLTFSRRPFPPLIDATVFDADL
jgi:hypothetical protein